MIKNPDKFQKFENDLIRKEKVDIQRNFQIYEAMYKEAVALGALPLKDPLEGIETKIKIAKVINSVSASPFEDCPGTD